jgi:streptogramin lyase
VEAFYQANHDLIYSYVYRSVRNREEAEDLTSQIFLKVVSGLDDTHGAKAAKLWLFQLFAVPDRHALLMEIASDGQGTIWVTSFTPCLLFRFRPGTGTFTTYTTPFTSGQQSALYGLLVTSTGWVWVTMLAENVIARLDAVAGRFVYYRIPTPGTSPLGLAMDANQRLWFTGVDMIGVLHP